MKIIKEAYEYWGAEGRKITAISIPPNELANMLRAVVFITSNWIGNKEMTEGCKEAGIPCFGTLWDFVSFIILPPRCAR
jgi:hypothetical protein